MQLFTTLRTRYQSRIRHGRLNRSQGGERTNAPATSEATTSEAASPTALPALSEYQENALSTFASKASEMDMHSLYRAYSALQKHLRLAVRENERLRSLLRIHGIDPEPAPEDVVQNSEHGVLAQPSLPFTAPFTAPMTDDNITAITMEF